MTGIQLYRFIEDKEWHFFPEDDDVLLFIDIPYIHEWNTLLGYNILGDEGIKCVMKSGYFCFWMNDICEYFGINIDEVFDSSKV